MRLRVRIFYALLGKDIGDERAQYQPYYTGLNPPDSLDAARVYPALLSSQRSQLLG